MVEVKVRSTIPYAHGQYPCYSFPVVQIEAYENFKADDKISRELWIVDPKEKVIRLAYLKLETDPDRMQGLENEQYFSGKKFPFDQKTKYGDYRFFHVKQFSTLCDLTSEEVHEFAEIEQTPCKENVIDRNEPIAEPVEILTAPDGTNIDILSVKNDCRFFVKVARVSHAIGYKNPSINEQSPLIIAANRLGVEHYRFQTQRLSGGDSYGREGYYFNVRDVPKVLAQYCELHHGAKSSTRQARYNQASTELKIWFESFVLPKLTPTQISEQKKTFVEQLVDMTGIGKTDLVQSILDLRQKKFDREQEQIKELLI